MRLPSYRTGKRPNSVQESIEQGPVIFDFTEDEVLEPQRVTVAGGRSALQQPPQQQNAARSASTEQNGGRRSARPDTSRPMTPTLRETGPARLQALLELAAAKERELTELRKGVNGQPQVGPKRAAATAKSCYPTLRRAASRSTVGVGPSLAASIIQQALAGAGPPARAQSLNNISAAGQVTEGQADHAVLGPKLKPVHKGTDDSVRQAVSAAAPGVGQLVPASPVSYALSPPAAAEVGAASTSSMPAETMTHSVHAAAEAFDKQDIPGAVKNAVTTTNDPAIQAEKLLLSWKRQVLVDAVNGVTKHWDVLYGGASTFQETKAMGLPPLEGAVAGMGLSTGLDMAPGTLEQLRQSRRNRVAEIEAAVRRCTSRGLAPANPGMGRRVAAIVTNLPPPRRDAATSTAVLEFRSGRSNLQEPAAGEGMLGPSLHSSISEDVAGDSIADAGAAIEDPDAERAVKRCRIGVEHAPAGSQVTVAQRTLELVQPRTLAQRAPIRQSVSGSNGPLNRAEDRALLAALPVPSLLDVAPQVSNGKQLLQQSGAQCTRDAALHATTSQPNAEFFKFGLESELVVEGLAAAAATPTQRSGLGPCVHEPAGAIGGAVEIDDEAQLAQNPGNGKDAEPPNYKKTGCDAGAVSRSKAQGQEHANDKEHEGCRDGKRRPRSPAARSAAPGRRPRSRARSRSIPQSRSPGHNDRTQRARVHKARHSAKHGAASFDSTRPLQREDRERGRAAMRATPKAAERLSTGGTHRNWVRSRERSRDRGQEREHSMPGRDWGRSLSREHGRSRARDEGRQRSAAGSRRRVSSSSPETINGANRAKSQTQRIVSGSQDQLVRGRRILKDGDDNGKHHAHSLPSKAGLPEMAVLAAGKAAKGVVVGQPDSQVLCGVEHVERHSVSETPSTTDDVDAVRGASSALFGGLVLFRRGYGLTKAANTVSATATAEASGAAHLPGGPVVITEGPQIAAPLVAAPQRVLENEFVLTVASNELHPAMKSHAAAASVELCGEASGASGASREVQGAALGVTPLTARSSPLSTANALVQLAPSVKVQRVSTGTNQSPAASTVNSQAMVGASDKIVVCEGGGGMQQVEGGPYGAVGCNSSAEKAGNSTEAGSNEHTRKPSLLGIVDTFSQQVASQAGVRERISAGRAIEANQHGQQCTEALVQPVEVETKPTTVSLARRVTGKVVVNASGQFDAGHESHEPSSQAGPTQMHARHDGLATADSSVGGVKTCASWGSAAAVLEEDGGTAVLASQTLLVKPKAAAIAGRSDGGLPHAGAASGRMFTPSTPSLHLHVWPAADLLARPLQSSRPSAVQDAHVAQALLIPQSAAMNYPYQSPLIALSSYRFSPTFAAVTGAALASPTYTNLVDPHWPLCRFEMRGTCQDPSCRFQHSCDFLLNRTELVRELAHGSCLGSSAVDVQAGATAVAPAPQEAAAAAATRGQAVQKPVRVPADKRQYDPAPAMRTMRYHHSGPGLHHTHVEGGEGTEGARAPVLFHSALLCGVVDPMPQRFVLPTWGFTLPGVDYLHVPHAPAVARVRGVPPTTSAAPAATCESAPATPALPDEVQSEGPVSGDMFAAASSWSLPSRTERRRYFQSPGQLSGVAAHINAKYAGLISLARGSDCGQPSEFRPGRVPHAGQAVAEGKCEGRVGSQHVAELYLMWALEHVTWGASGPDVLPDKRDAAISVLAEGLEQVPADKALWELYIALFGRKLGLAQHREMAALAAGAANYGRLGYRAWLVVAATQLGWRRTLACYRVALIDLCSYLHDDRELAQQVAQVAADLALRILHVCACAGHGQEGVQWLLGADDEKSAWLQDAATAKRSFKQTLAELGPYEPQPPSAGGEGVLHASTVKEVPGALRGRPWPLASTTSPGPAGGRQAPRLSDRGWDVSALLTEPGDGVGALALYSRRVLRAVLCSVDPSLVSTVLGAAAHVVVYGELPDELTARLACVKAGFFFPTWRQPLPPGIPKRVAYRCVHFAVDMVRRVAGAALPGKNQPTSNSTKTAGTSMAAGHAALASISKDVLGQGGPRPVCYWQPYMRMVRAAELLAGPNCMPSMSKLGKVAKTTARVAQQALQDIMGVRPDASLLSEGLLQSARRAEPISADSLGRAALEQASEAWPSGWAEGKNGPDADLGRACAETLVAHGACGKFQMDWGLVDESEAAAGTALASAALIMCGNRIAVRGMVACAWLSAAGTNGPQGSCRLAMWLQGEVRAGRCSLADTYRIVRHGDGPLLPLLKGSGRPDLVLEVPTLTAAAPRSQPVLMSLWAALEGDACWPWLYDIDSPLQHCQGKLSRAIHGQQAGDANQASSSGIAPSAFCMVAPHSSKSADGKGSDGTGGMIGSRENELEAQPLELQQWLWRQHLLWLAACVHETDNGLVCGPSSSGRGGKPMQSAVAFEALMHALRHYVAWLRRCQMLQPLEEVGQGNQAADLLQATSVPDLVDACDVLSKVVRHLAQAQIVQVVEAMVEQLAPSAPLAPLLLAVAHLHPDSGSWIKWCMPLLAASLLCAAPVPQPPRVWAAAVSLCRRHSAPSARELCAAGLAALPFSHVLWRLYAEMQAELGPTEGEAALAAMAAHQL